MIYCDYCKKAPAKHCVYEGSPLCEGCAGVWNEKQGRPETAVKLGGPSISEHPIPGDDNSHNNEKGVKDEFG